MKVVINVCFGGFGVSPVGTKRWAELKGRECYFFMEEYPAMREYRPVAADKIGNSLFWAAFDIPNPNEVLAYSKPWNEMSAEERNQHNDLYAAHSLNLDSIPRDDPDLVRVVEELGGGRNKGASGWAADLKIVEIPDGIEYEIEEYDGSEHIAEVHRTWG